MLLLFPVAQPNRNSLSKGPRVQIRAFSTSFPLMHPLHHTRRKVPPPPLCASTGWSKHGVGVETLFSGFFGTAVFVVLNAGLGVCDALVEGKMGSFMSVIVHSVHPPPLSSPPPPLVHPSPPQGGEPSLGP